MCFIGKVGKGAFAGLAICGVSVELFSVLRNLLYGQRESSPCKQAMADDVLGSFVPFHWRRLQSVAVLMKTE